MKDASEGVVSESGYISWEIDVLAEALKVTREDVREYFTDGRRVSFILERRIAREVIGGTLAASEGAGFDLLDKQGGKWEVRSISKGGIYFCPSYMVGSGRKFELNGFLEKLSELAGYIVSDIESFPRIRYWIVPAQLVSKWWTSGDLGKITKISRNKALSLVGG